MIHGMIRFLPTAIKLVKDVLSTDPCCNVCRHVSILKPSSFFLIGSIRVVAAVNCRLYSSGFPAIGSILGNSQCALWPDMVFRMWIFPAMYSGYLHALQL
jgi:hypothetical protein